jgi:hypothetical protein
MGAHPILIDEHKGAIKDIQLAFFHKQYGHSILYGNGLEWRKWLLHDKAFPLVTLFFLVLLASVASIYISLSSLRNSTDSSFSPGR